MLDLTTPKETGLRLRLGYEFAYDCPQSAPMLLMLNVHPSRRGDLETPDTIYSQPGVDVLQYFDSFGNLCSRLTAPPGRMTLSADFVIRDPRAQDLYQPDAQQARVEDLPNEVLVYLLGSRYCETDRLSNEAWALFGGTAPGWSRVQAICDYVHNHIRFGYEHASPFKSANDAHHEALGVCRDYAHLAITFCRCMNIPARYCTGYIPDIEIPITGAPMDFCAWMEVYLSGRWWTFDARNNIPRIGRVLMARGRDATDVALANIFGIAYLANFEVIAEELPG